MDRLKEKTNKKKKKKNKTKKVQSRDLKFQTAQYNLSKISWRYCFVLVWLYTSFSGFLIQLLLYIYVSFK